MKNLILITLTLWTYTALSQTTTVKTDTAALFKQWQAEMTPKIAQELSKEVPVTFITFTVGKRRERPLIAIDGYFLNGQRLDINHKRLADWITTIDALTMERKDKK